MKRFNQLKKYIVGGVMSSVSALSFAAAQPIDSGEALAQIAIGAVACGAIGVAMIGVASVVGTTRMARSAAR